MDDEIDRNFKMFNSEIKLKNNIKNTMDNLYLNQESYKSTLFNKCNKYDYFELRDKDYLSNVKNYIDNDIQSTNLLLSEINFSLNKEKELKMKEFSIKRRNNNEIWNLEKDYKNIYYNKNEFLLDYKKKANTNNYYQNDSYDKYRFNLDRKIDFLKKDLLEKFDRIKLQNKAVEIDINPKKINSKFDENKVVYLSEQKLNKNLIEENEAEIIEIDTGLKKDITYESNSLEQIEEQTEKSYSESNTEVYEWNNKILNSKDMYSNNYKDIELPSQIIKFNN